MLLLLIFNTDKDFWRRKSRKRKYFFFHAPHKWSCKFIQEILLEQGQAYEAEMCKYNNHIPHTLFYVGFPYCPKTLFILESNQDKIISQLLQEFLVNTEFLFFSKHVQMLYSSVNATNSIFEVWNRHRYWLLLPRLHLNHIKLKSMSDAYLILFNGLPTLFSFQAWYYEPLGIHTSVPCSFFGTLVSHVMHFVTDNS